MLKVGLTGGIGSGKSTVSKIIKAFSIPIIDADIIAREVLDKNPKILTEIKNNFGEEFIDESGKLKRKEFGNYIFENKEKKKQYEDIILPYIISEIFNQFNIFEKNGEKICVLDAPTLIENNLQKEMDKNILVWVDKETQLKRVMRRDNMDVRQAKQWIEAQIPLDTKRGMVDYIIDNSNEFDSTRKQLVNILNRIKEVSNED